MIELDIPSSWLTKQLVSNLVKSSIAAERDKTIHEIRVSFVNLRDEWNETFGEVYPEDEIWEFDSPGDHWDSLCGRAGIALVRVGRPINGIVIETN